MDSTQYNIYDGLEMQLYYINMSSFKEKYYNIIKNTIMGSRLNQFLVFKCPCIISFDNIHDNKHQFPLINELQNFKRGQTNGMVFDLLYNSNNNGKYDKLIIYYSQHGKNKCFGYLLFNSKTKKTLHRFLIDDLPDAVPQNLNRDFNEMLDDAFYNFYRSKGDTIKEHCCKCNKHVNILSIKDYNLLIKSHTDRLKIGFTKDFVHNYN